MAASPIDVVGNWLQNLLDPEVVNKVVAPDAERDHDVRLR
jgi:hypothetical protein